MANILIVDDEVDIAELLEEEFEEFGHDVMVATGGIQAVSLIKDNCFDIVLSDYKMPDGDGFEILKNVMALCPDKRPIFYFISGQAELEPNEATRLGVKKFFSKPFDLDELVQEINDAASQL